MLDLDTEKNGTKMSSNGNSSTDLSDFLRCAPGEEARQKNVWDGWAGTTIMLFGVAAPALLLCAVGYFGFRQACGLILRHPLETLAPHLNAKPTCEIISDNQTAQTLAALYGAQETRQVLSDRNNYLAAQIARSYHLVTPVTAAVVLERASDYQRFGLSDENQTQLANAGGTPFSHGGGGGSGTGFSRSRFAATEISMLPGSSLQGSTNGTVGPQGADATYVTGVYTAGTIRVNNLANLEAMLNILANGLEMFGVAGGALLALNACTRSSGMLFGITNVSRRKRLAIAAILVLIGLSVPGLVNSLVASARDCNLFS